MRSFRVLAGVLLPPLRWVASALAWLVAQPLAGLWWLGFLRVELWHVEGEERSSHLPLSLLCAASRPNRHYLLQLVFGDSYRERRLGRFWLWNVAKAIPAASGCSMIVSELCESHLKFTGSSDWFFLPVWVFGEVDLPRDANATRKVRGDLQKIRHRALQFEVTRDPRQFDDFYYNMYTPHITRRFGNYAEVTPYKQMRAVFDSCDLLVVKDQERTIAGQLILYKGPMAYLWEMGVRDGDPDQIKRGAGGSAVFHFSLQYLQDKGYKKAGLGWSRPFLRDGSLQFKRNWSQRIVDGYPNGFALRVLSPTPATRAFLGNNPFVFRHRGRFHAAVFVDADEPLSADNIRQIDKDYFHAGLSRLLIYCRRSEDAPAPNPIPADLSEHVELRCLDDLPGSAAEFA